MVLLDKYRGGSKREGIAESRSGSIEENPELEKVKECFVPKKKKAKRKKLVLSEVGIEN